MATQSVRDAVLDTLRAHEMTVMFGNPGSTELPFLADFPDDFTYVLALHESIAVGMADGYAQALGRPTLAMLHTAPGTGNAMGAIYNAQVQRAPVVILAGQQSRSMIEVGHLANRDATRLPEPLVKWSNQPARAEEVPGAMARAIHLAGLPPRGPAYLSVPLDDWAVPTDAATVRHQLARSVTGKALPDPAAVLDLARRLVEAESPAFVAGPDIDACGAWDAAIALAERRRLPVYASPASGGGRIGFPESHPAFRGILPMTVPGVAEALSAHDLVLVVGSPIFPYFIEMPGDLLAEGTSLVAIVSDPGDAAKAPMGDAIVADPALALDALLAELPASDRDVPAALPLPSPPADSAPMSSARVSAVLSAALPADAVLVVEAPTAALALRAQLRMDRPGSFFYGSGGGLGWGLPAAIGVALALPQRPVVAVLGDGSTQYAIQGLWTAAAYGVPVTFVVLRNEQYASLRFMSTALGISGAPSFDVPGLEIAAMARAYGIHSQQIETADELREALSAASQAGAPRLLEVRVAQSEPLI